MGVYLMGCTRDMNPWHGAPCPILGIRQKIAMPTGDPAENRHAYKEEVGPLPRSFTHCLPPSHPPSPPPPLPASPLPSCLPFLVKGDFDESFKEEDAILRINTAIRWNQSTLRCWLAHLAPSLAPAADLPTLVDCLCALAGVQYLHPFAVTQAKAERDYLVEKERRKEARKARKEALGQGQDRSAKRAKTQCST